MRILHKDFKAGKVKLQIENLDDLWYLYNLISAQNLVLGTTYRREKALDKLRPDRGEKKKMVLGVRVDKVEFHEFSDILRVLGKIEEGAVDIGSYHTLNFCVGDRITIVKDWSESVLAQLEEAIKESKKPKIIFLALDYNEATFSLLHSYGIEHVATISSAISGKYYLTKDYKENFYNEVLVKLKGLRREDLPVIVLGPGFAKEEFFKFVKEREKELSKNCYLESAGSAGIAGINEILKKGFSVKVLQDARVALETQLVEKLFDELAKNGNCAYGRNEVRTALEQGAVETLLVIDKLIRSGEAEELFKHAKATKAKSVIISTLHDSGKKMESLGGIGALLRYRISY
ncbi:MAG: mRNA surveillance protein pelota [Candidatus Thermoplasmatota archaeon]|nr:mRNA surveillance protein pelota [Candidatus Thermoplasmatota archaeon]